MLRSEFVKLLYHYPLGTGSSRLPDLDKIEVVSATP